MRLRDLFLYDIEGVRHAWVRAQLATLPKGAKILDAGCGPQPYRADCAHLEYFAQDFGKYHGDDDGYGFAAPGFSYGKLDYVGDIWNIPVPDGSFDAVLCSEVLEHIPYPRETVLELARLLNPGGTLILTAPFCSLPHFSPYFFASGFSINFYKQAFDDCGIVAELNWRVTKHADAQKSLPHLAAIIRL